MTDPEAGFDMDAAVASVADGLGLTAPVEDELPEGKPEGKPEGEGTAAPADDLSAAPSKEGAEPASAAAPTPRAPPKSWAKEYHEDWSKLTPRQQEYVEKREKDFLDGNEQYRGEAGFAKEFKDILIPYKPMLAAMGVDEKQAVGYLLNAQYRLTNGTPEQRAEAYQQIGRDLGLAGEPQTDPNAPATDPLVIKLQERLKGVESALTQRQETDLRAAQADAQTKVDQFASDPANEHFDAVAQDMVPHINAGLSLKEAYDKAVWANSVTREQMLQKRLTDAETEKQEKARIEGEAAQKATAHNVRGVESRKAPTEKKGSMDDTMRETLREIRGRAH